MSGLLGRLRRAISSPEDPGDGPERRIRLIVGLGNPGREYASTRHNVGFWTINRHARRHGIELKSAGVAALGAGHIGGQAVALAKPRTFYNESGRAVWSLIRRLRLDDARELLVVCDELDLPVGKVRLRAKGGGGGQKGLQSIVRETGSDQFARLRIGIGRPVVRGEPSYEPDVVANYVLSEPPPDERRALDETIERAIEMIEVAVTEGVERAMQRFN